MSKTVDITTTQKITIEYELASPMERLIAFVIDMVVLGVLSGILTVALASIFIETREYLMFLFLVPLWLFYTLAQELFFDGRTLGKKAIGIKVVRLDGEHPTTGDFILRWSMRLVDIWTSFMAVAGLSMIISERNQRLGDFAANTIVIKLKSKSSFTLNEILKIKSNTNHEIQYPNVYLLTEEDMLVIKTLILRWEKYKNKAHASVILQMINKKLLPLLDLPEGSVKAGSEIRFLKDLITDYIVLTR